MNEGQHLDRDALRGSYFVILATFARDKRSSSEQVAVIYEWGSALGITTEELEAVVRDPNAFAHHQPVNQHSSIDQLYNLVYMIYLDNRVDDHEIDILMKYAEHLGFPQHIIGDIMKAILTAPSDGIPPWQVKNELKDLLEASLR